MRITSQTFQHDYCPINKVKDFLFSSLFYSKDNKILKKIIFETKHELRKWIKYFEIEMITQNYLAEMFPQKILKVEGYTIEQDKSQKNMFIAYNCDKDAQPLFQYLNDNDVRPEEQMNICEQLLQLAVILGETQKYHRNLKPNNVIYTKNKFVQLTDFGSARTHFKNFTKEYVTKVEQKWKSDFLFFCPQKYLEIMKEDIDFRDQEWQNINSDDLKIIKQADMWALGIMILQVFENQQNIPENIDQTYALDKHKLNEKLSNLDKSNFFLVSTAVKQLLSFSESNYSNKEPRDILNDFCKARTIINLKQTQSITMSTGVITQVIDDHSYNNQLPHCDNKFYYMTIQEQKELEKLQEDDKSSTHSQKNNYPIESFQYKGRSISGHSQQQQIIDSDITSQKIINNVGRPLTFTLDNSIPLQQQNQDINQPHTSIQITQPNIQNPQFVNFTQMQVIQEDLNFEDSNRLPIHNGSVENLTLQSQNQLNQHVDIVPQGPRQQQNPIQRTVISIQQIQQPQEINDPLQQTAIISRQQPSNTTNTNTQNQTGQLIPIDDEEHPENKIPKNNIQSTNLPNNGNKSLKIITDNSDSNQSQFQPIKINQSQLNVQQTSQFTPFVEITDNQIPPINTEQFQDSFRQQQIPPNSEGKQIQQGNIKKINEDDQIESAFFYPLPVEFQQLPNKPLQPNQQNQQSQDSIVSVTKLPPQQNQFNFQNINQIPIIQDNQQIGQSNIQPFNQNPQTLSNVVQNPISLIQDNNNPKEFPLQNSPPQIQDIKLPKFSELRNMDEQDLVNLEFKISSIVEQVSDLPDGKDKDQLLEQIDDIHEIITIKRATIQEIEKNKLNSEQLTFLSDLDIIQQITKQQEQQTLLQLITIQNLNKKIDNFFQNPSMNKIITNNEEFQLLNRFQLKEYLNILEQLSKTVPKTQINRIFQWKNKIKELIKLKSAQDQLKKFINNPQMLENILTKIQYHQLPPKDQQTYKKIIEATIPIAPQRIKNCLIKELEQLNLNSQSPLSNSTLSQDNMPLLDNNNLQPQNNQFQIPPPTMITGRIQISPQEQLQIDEKNKNLKLGPSENEPEDGYVWSRNPIICAYQKSQIDIQIAIPQIYSEYTQEEYCQLHYQVKQLYKQDTYKGCWKENHPHGLGIKMEYKHFAIYNGIFEEGLFVWGQVLELNPNNYLTEYIGKYNKEHKVKHSLKSILNFYQPIKTPKEIIQYQFTCYESYNGSFCLGYIHGEGQMKYNDDSIYVGTWQKNKRSGYGTYVKTSNKRYYSYEGEFLNDKFHGNGIVKYDEQGKLTEIGQYEYGKPIRCHELFLNNVKQKVINYS